MPKIQILISLAIVAALSWTCSDSTEPPRATSIALSASQVELDAIGATEQLTAQVLDQNGQPMPQEPITWSSADEAVATASSNGRVTAVANGTATITARSGAASGSAAVTVRQVVATIRKVTGDGQTGTVGQALALALVVEARDRLSATVAGASVQFAVARGGGSVDPSPATTGSNGRASTVWTLGTAAGTDHQVDATHTEAPGVSFTATALADAPASVEKVQGDGQTGAVATALSDSIVVRVRDAVGNLVPGQSVSFASTQGGGSVSPTSVNTDLQGRAATEWTLGAGLGDNTLEVTVAGVAPVTFGATSELGPPTLISIEAGDDQNATVGTAVATQPTVKVTDAGGNPVSDAPVTFAVTDGGGSVSGAEPATDAAGLAAVGSWTLGTVAGANLLKASLSNGAFVNFSATGTPGVAANLAKDAGDNRTSTAGLPLPDPLPTVRVTDEYGNGVGDVPVTFEVISGGGSITGADPTTDAGGRAAVGSWTLGPDPGTNELTATVSGLPSVTFTATGLGGAANIEKVAGDGQSATVGTAVDVAPTVKLTDSGGNPVEGQEVTFLVQAGGGSTTNNVATSDADGLAAVGSWTLGTGAVTNALTAQTDGLAPVTFTATATAGPPTSVTVNDGDGQTGLVGYAVNIPPSVRVTDTYANPVAGVTVNFGVTGGGGSVTDATAASDDDGIATVGAWTLGAAPALNTLDATAAGIGSVAFNATGVAGAYDIEIRFLTSMTASQQQTFLDAAERWEELLYGELSNVLLDIPAGSCGSNAPAMNETIDDLVIFATIEPIDGSGGTLGQAGPCYIRSSNKLTLLGRMRFDEADVPSLEASGRFDEVIVHEMGHVVGFGTIWPTLELLADPSLSGGTDPHFTGARAIEAFDRIGGATYTSNKVPVENTGGPGTADAHWRESVFSNELMTGFINSGANPLSEVTVASLWDMGYTVNLDGAEDFSLSSPMQAFGAPVAVRLVDDIARGPIYVVDGSGRVVGVIPER
jgi:adhesin/invasin